MKYKVYKEKNKVVFEFTKEELKELIFIQQRLFEEEKHKCMDTMKKIIEAIEENDCIKALTLEDNLLFSSMNEQIILRELVEQGTLTEDRIDEYTHQRIDIWRRLVECEKMKEDMKNIVKNLVENDIKEVYTETERYLLLDRWL